MKKYLLGLLTGLVVIGTCAVIATETLIPSTSVTYDKDGEETTVNAALNDLIGDVNIIKTTGTATAADIKSGKTAYVKGDLVTGTASSNTLEIVKINFNFNGMLGDGSYISSSKNFASSIPSGKKVKAVYYVTTQTQNNGNPGSHSISWSVSGTTITVKDTRGTVGNQSTIVSGYIILICE